MKKPDAIKIRHWLSPGQLEALKLLAVLAMLADHTNKVLWQENYEVLAFVGRLAFPLFASLLVWHLVYHTRNAWQYAGRLLLAGVLSQPAYALAFSSSQPVFVLNIFFTLAISVALIAAWQSLHQQTKPWLWSLWGFALAAALVLSPFLEYFFIGLALIGSLYGALRWHHRFAWVVPIPAFAALSYLWPPQGAVVLVLLILLVVHFLPIQDRWPVPWWIWYAVYPVHLLVLAGLSHV